MFLGKWKKERKSAREQTAKKWDEWSIDGGTAAANSRAKSRVRVVVEDGESWKAKHNEGESEGSKKKCGKQNANNKGTSHKDDDEHNTAA